MNENASIEAWREGWTRIKLELLPLAIRTKCMPREAAVWDLVPGPQSELAESKRHGRELLCSLAKICVVGATYAIDPDDGFGEDFGDPVFKEWAANGVLSGVATALYFECRGYLSALAAVSHESAGRATGGRLRVGRESRDKVRQAAEGRRHLSREAAAIDIAREINLSSSTVRRRLSELFPGDEWALSADAAHTSG